MQSEEAHKQGQHLRNDSQSCQSAWVHTHTHTPAFSHSCFFGFFLSTCSGSRFCLFWTDFTFRYLKHRKRRKGNFPLSFPHDPRKLEKLGESIACVVLTSLSMTDWDSRATCASVLAESILYSITTCYCHVAPLSLEILYKRKRGEEHRPTPFHPWSSHKASKICRNCTEDQRKFETEHICGGKLAA